MTDLDGVPVVELTQALARLSLCYSSSLLDLFLHHRSWKTDHTQKKKENSLEGVVFLLK